MTVIVVTRFLFGGPEIGPVLKRLMKMAESHRAMLLEIEYPPSKVFYLATEYLELEGNRYDGIVSGGLYIDHKIDYFKESDADVRITLLQKRLTQQIASEAKFTDIFATYDLTGKRIRVIEYIKDVAYADLPILLKGRISHPFRYTDEKVEFDVVADKSFYTHIPPKIILKNDYPDAPELSLEKRIPFVFGEMKNEYSVGGGSYPTPKQPRLGSIAQPINGPEGKLRCWNHAVKSVGYLYEVREGFFCLVTGVKGADWDLLPTDSDDQAYVNDSGRRQVCVNPFAHEIEAGTVDNPEAMYDQKVDSPVCRIYKGGEVSFMFNTLSKLGGQKVIVASMPLMYFQVTAITGTGNKMQIFHRKRGASEDLIKDNIVSTGYDSVFIGNDPDQENIHNWEWADDKMVFKYTADSSAHYIEVSEIWWILQFYSDHRFGRGRWAYERRPLLINERQRGMSALLGPPDLQKDIREISVFMAGCEGYAEAGVLKDHLVDVIERIHTQMLDTNKFNINATSFANAKTDIESYFGSGYPKISTCIHEGVDPEQCILEMGKMYGLSKVVLPSGTSTWKPDIHLIYHKLGVSSATYSPAITEKIFKNLQVGKTDTKDIKNEIIVKFDYGYGDQKYLNEYHIKRNPNTGVWFSDPTDTTRESAADDSYNNYGHWSEGFIIELQHNYQPLTGTAEAEQALKVLRWWFDFFHKPKITLELDIYVSDMKIGDIIEFDSSVDEDWGRLFGQTWNGKVFRVLGLGFSSEGVHWRHVVAETIPASL